VCAINTFVKFSKALRLVFHQGGLDGERKREREANQTNGQHQFFSAALKPQQWSQATSGERLELNLSLSLSLSLSACKRIMRKMSKVKRNGAK